MLRVSRLVPPKKLKYLDWSCPKINEYKNNLTSHPYMLSTHYYLLHPCVCTAQFAVHSLVRTGQCAYRMAVFLYLKILVEKGGTSRHT